MKQPLFIILLCVPVFFISCNSAQTGEEKANVSRTADSVLIGKPEITCDTFAVDVQPVEDYHKALSVWLETTSLDWFLEKRQSAWREAKGWHKKNISIDSIPILKCLRNNRDKIFLYIPNHHCVKGKNGTDFIQFFIVNNSSDTLKIPCIDATINNISSSVSLISQKDTIQQWLSFQKTEGFVECGNSFWTMKLPPNTAIETQLESSYISLGNTAVQYRIELTLDKQVFYSNSISIKLMQKQLPYLGSKFN